MGEDMKKLQANIAAIKKIMKEGIKTQTAKLVPESVPKPDKK